MKSDISAYISENLTPSMGYDFRKSLDIFEKFELEGYEDDLSNLLMTADTIDPAQMQDSFRGIIQSKIDFILLNHMIVLKPNCYLNEQNEILYALYILQDLEDYSLACDIIENNSDSAFALSLILALYCTLPAINIMEMIKSMDSSLLDRIIHLSELAINKASLDEDVEKQQLRETIIKGIDNFKDYIHISCLGINMINKGYQVGYPLSYYLPFVKDEITITNVDELLEGVTPREGIVNNIISLVLLTDPGYSNLEETVFNHLDEMVPTVTEPLKELLHLKIKRFQEFVGGLSE
jgi:hypothetical protein